jgi:hypothetical protein
MRIGEFLKAYNLEIKLVPGVGDNLVISIENPDGGIVEFLTDNNNLTGSLGSGKTSDVALKNLCKDISGRTMVLNSTSERKRKEIEVPGKLVL